MTKDKGQRTSGKGLTRRALGRLPLEPLHRARNWSKADVSLAEWPVGSGRRVVVKDLKRRPLWFRLFYGRAALGREWKALRALRGVAGVPGAVSRPDADAVVIEYVEGAPLSQVAHGALPERVLRQVEEQVRALHRRGVTHGDLHRQNVLVPADELANEENGAGRDVPVWFIDWATANVFGPQPRGLKKWSFEEWRALDLRAVAKLKAFNAPQTLSAAELALLQGAGSRLYRAVKALRRIGEVLRGKKKSGHKLQAALHQIAAERQQQEGRR